MRQIGDDFNVNPFDAGATKAIDPPTMTASLLKSHIAWTRNTFSSKAHQFCSKEFNMSSADNAEAETNNFYACLNRYKNAFSIFAEEQGVFNA